MNNIVLIWAGGTGMSWLAMMLYDLWYHHLICINNISTDLTDHLISHGIKVVIGHGNYTIQREDIVIYSDIQAIVDGPEIQQSLQYQSTPTKKHFHICMTYNQFMGEISKHFITIAVTGSNGKTSTTGMLIHALATLSSHEQENNTTSKSMLWIGIVGWLMPNYDHQWYYINPNIDIQSDIRHLFDHILHQKHQLNYNLLKKYLFVIEACEYKEHFLLYDRDYTCVTNIVRDHVDYFQTESLYIDVFHRLVSTTRHHTILSPVAHRRLWDISWPYTISTPHPVKNPSLIGLYAADNAGMIATLISTVYDTYNPSLLDESFGTFAGVGRRMEYIWQINHNPVYSDYSHHAPAIAGNITALKKQFPDHHLCVVFQPHQAQRVIVGRQEFKDALADSDQLIIYRLYTAREDIDILKKSYDILQPYDSFDQLWQVFAEDLWGTYIIDDTILHQTLDTTLPNTIIVIFSAGDLDEVVCGEMR